MKAQPVWLRRNHLPMFRKDLIELLHNHPMRLYDIAKPLDIDPKDVEDDIRHLARTLKRSGEYKLIVHPATCHKCGFVFSEEHLHKPGKCPHCHGTWITEPLVEVVGNQ